jgi:pimeloyl-ACP methyl ester carboxylesterase
MDLLPQSVREEERNLVVNEINITQGTGMFLVEGGYDASKTILIHYYLPETFTRNSKVIFIIPGAGRNGRDYRNAWKEASEKYNLLVLTPEYSEENYPEFWSYNLGGMIYDVNIENETFKIHQNPDRWIFGDFDRIFAAVAKHLKLTVQKYDMFGHSAGGQILHRLALFHPENKANRILAANSGWYTLPSYSEPFPYGLLNILASPDVVDFSSKLVLFLGEDDDENETRGHLRRSPEVDKQGLHRYARGLYFYQRSKEMAEKAGAEFNWQLEGVKNVGHDYKAMSHKASAYLYGEK